MRRFFTMLVLATVLTMSPLVASVATADEYWDGYWGWYDGSYRPYYTQRYYAPRNGYYDGGSYYGSPYRQRYYGDGYYGRRYGGNYYGTPNVGYREFRGGGQVNVGGLRFGWR